MGIYYEYGSMAPKKKDKKDKMNKKKMCWVGGLGGQIDGLDVGM